MTQNAIVLNSFPDGMAEVAVIRGTACGSNCGNCESCIYQNELRTRAVNTIQAVRGQKVVIESKSSEVYKAEILIYLLPLFMLVIGYMVCSLLGLREWLSITAGFASLIIGVCIVIFTQKNKPDMRFEIVRAIHD